MIIRDLGLQDYLTTYQAMRQFTEDRTTETEDELWLLEHQPVFSQGSHGSKEHVFNLNNIPLVHSDRGGQVTYHGPGQLIAYTLFDLKRLNIGVRKLVHYLEDSVIQLLREYDLVAYSDAKAPGVYIENAKIASLGLRVRKGGCYHGISLNVAMSLTPFLSINPCGLKGMKMVDMAMLGCDPSMQRVKRQFVKALTEQLANKRLK